MSMLGILYIESIQKRIKDGNVVLLMNVFENFILFKEFLKDPVVCLHRCKHLGLLAVWEKGSKIVSETNCFWIYMGNIWIICTYLISKPFGCLKYPPIIVTSYKKCHMKICFEALLTTDSRSLHLFSSNFCYLKTSKSSVNLRYCRQDQITTRSRNPNKQNVVFYINVWTIVRFY